MGEIVVLSLVAALNPVLVTATTIMLLLERPLRLMLGWWLGAMITSVTLGNVIVFALQGSGFAKSSSNKAHPAGTLALAGILLVVVVVLATGRDQRYKERRAAHKTRDEKKEPPRWQRTLTKGSPKATFVLGLLLTFPGGAYLAALDKLGKLHYSTVATVLVVIGFCLVQQLLLEIPIIAFKIAPEQTPAAIVRAKAWAGAHWRHVAIYGLSVIVAGLLAIGINELL